MAGLDCKPLLIGVEVVLSYIRVLGQDRGHCYSGVFWMLIPIMNFHSFLDWDY
jgi:hypothetical protein